MAMSVVIAMAIVGYLIWSVLPAQYEKVRYIVAIKSSMLYQSFHQQVQVPIFNQLANESTGHQHNNNVTTTHLKCRDAQYIHTQLDTSYINKVYPMYIPLKESKDVNSRRHRQFLSSIRPSWFYLLCLFFITA